MTTKDETKENEKQIEIKTLGILPKLMKEFERELLNHAIISIFDQSELLIQGIIVNCIIGFRSGLKKEYRNASIDSIFLLALDIQHNYIEQVKKEMIKIESTLLDELANFHSWSKWVPIWGEYKMFRELRTARQPIMILGRDNMRVQFEEIIHNKVVGKDKEVLKNGWYYISVRHTGYHLDVTNYSKEDGALITTWSRHCGPVDKTHDNQIFYIEKQNDGNYTIKSKHSGKYFDIWKQSKNKGAVIHQWKKHDGKSQRFYFDHKGKGNYKIKSVLSGLWLDVDGRSTRRTTKIIQWDAVDHSNQLFRFMPARVE